MSAWDCSCDQCWAEIAYERWETRMATQNPFTVEQEPDGTLVQIGWDPDQP